MTDLEIVEGLMEMERMWRWAEVRVRQQHREGGPRFNESGGGWPLPPSPPPREGRALSLVHSRARPDTPEASALRGPLLQERRSGAGKGCTLPLPSPFRLTEGL